ncbi:hypothetical protein K469DRAFT_792903 [Zopfia rhizophila CBS 207.26]|uniref:Uncharacterized protein n=1 Tax=Zopfia rhizophila CBS 207.26 TaxID=1314779 RepID=A0A6A6DNL4_9PEZI|nr:hypothetical protein K469DRAFT_792903 [Zopfia rhizophila CBS 207.26]
MTTFLEAQNMITSILRVMEEQKREQVTVIAAIEEQKREHAKLIAWMNEQKREQTRPMTAMDKQKQEQATQVEALKADSTEQPTNPFHIYDTTDDDRHAAAWVKKLDGFELQTMRRGFWGF